MNSRHKKIYKPLIFLIFICMNMFVFFDQMIQNLTKKNENLKKNFFTELSSPNLEFKWRFQRVRYNISCKSIFDMDANEIQKAKLILTSKRNHKFPEKIPDVNFIFDKSKCYQFKKALGYNQSTGSKHDFPIGFSILVHANAEQVERFIRSIYQSQNVYCIHIDTKSKQEFRDAIHSITECFDNIFITTKAENILYGGFSRLQADINCLKDLLMLDSLIKSNKNFTNKRFVDWKYAFNLVGTEFFLRTNDELVKILKMYNGSNEITILKTNRVLHRRIKNEWLEDFKTFRLVNSGRNKSAPPHGYNITYGFSTYVISKNFAKYAVFDKRAQALLEWVRTTWSPDEIYWSTLQYNTKIYSQHGFIDDPEVQVYDSLNRYVKWKKERKDCNGKFRHAICLFSIEDLPELVLKPHFLINKFMLEYDPISYQCMEEWYDSRKRKNLHLNMFFYCKFLQSRSLIANCANVTVNSNFKKIIFFKFPYLFEI